jgi:chromosome partitioning protein
MAHTTLVLVLGALKGGSTKTSTCIALAVRASQEGRVVILDTDPQRSAHFWWRLRKEPDNPRVVPVDVTTRSIAREVARLKGEGVDVIFIDTPPAYMDHLEGAVREATAVLIPCRASIIDVDAVAPVVEVCKLYDKPYAFVLSAIDPKRKLVAAIAEALEDYGHVLPEQIHDQAVYASALTVGKTGPEANDATQAAAARAEIDALWRAAKKLMTKAR